jgi:hypothetical protein
MGRVRFLPVLIVSSALVLLALNAQAGFFNRPDVLDVWDSSSYIDTANDAQPHSWAYMHASESWAPVWGSMSGSLYRALDLVRMSARMYQPDTAKRNHKRARADQKGDMHVHVTLLRHVGGGPRQSELNVVASHSGFIPDCRGSLQANDRDNDGVFDLSPTGEDTIRAKLKCPRDFLLQLGFSLNEITTIQEVIGKRGTLTITLP